MFEKKGRMERFITLEEFIDNLDRGGEIEFFYKDKNYSIAHNNGKICMIQVGNESAEQLFHTIEELLVYNIDNNKCIKEIIPKLKIYFRCF